MQILEANENKLDEESLNYLNHVRDAAQRMGVLIDDLLTLSRVTRLPIDRVPVDLSALARKVLFSLAAADGSTRPIDCCLPDGLMADADPGLLRLVLENLLGNARKFTARKPLARIEVGKELRENQEVFFVRDNGAGFEMEYAQNLFSPFERLHSDAEFGGFGIGLATVKRIISRHGGRIWADAAKGSGATFFFTLAAAP